jgi:SAM-dependent methyltransferase
MEINNYDYIANLYDIYVPATFDISFFVNETKKSSGEVLELMSGTGRVSIPLLEAGVKLTCVDISGDLNAVLENKLKQKWFKADVYKMDVCELDIPKKFDMIIIPFHSFAHIASLDDQQKALDRIQQHLLPGGTFICTLGNPTLRQKSVDGQLRLFRKYPLEDGQGCLLLWIKEDFNPDDRRVVEAMQFFEEYDAKGVLRSKRLLELHFRLSYKDEFEELAKAAGFQVKALYGDYSYAEFSEDTSPFMIWLFERAGI